MKDESTNRYSQLDADVELERLLRDGHNAATDIRLMRLGGPHRFRAQVISILNNIAAMDSELVQLLRSDQINSITMLLANPDATPFLSRLDSEGATSWKIWRVRNQVRQFAQALLNIARSRKKPDSLLVAFHEEDMIWNIGIMGDNRVVLRPYDQRTGHDKSGRSLNFYMQSDASMVASFTGYFDAVARKISTRWLSAGGLPDDSPKWPSLYKGNAVRASSDDYDGTEEPLFAQDEVGKICSDPVGQVAEARWLAVRSKLRRSLQSLRPGQIRGPFQNIRGEGLRIQRICGPSLFDIMSSLASINGNIVPERMGKIHLVATHILSDSLAALLEFRVVAPQVLSPKRPYPYAAKLRNAFAEVRPYFPLIPPTVWEASDVDAIELGRELEAEATEPFRDAHLKNRLWKEGIGADRIVNGLLQMQVANLTQAIRNNVVDIDFETASDCVTEWDDLFHILFFEYSELGLSPGACTELLTKHLDLAQGNILFWRTGLMRSLREHCRRLWYAKVMPRTVRLRYARETPGFFLALARRCSENASGFLGLRRLLELLPPAFDSGFENASSEYSRPYVQDLTSIGGNIKKHRSGLRAFVGYAHEDRNHLERFQIVLGLLRRERILESWDDNQIGAGQDWKEKIRLALKRADIIFFLLSYDLLASDFVRDVELPIAFVRRQKRHAIIVPIVVRPVSLENSPFSRLHALPKETLAIEKWPNPDDAWVNIEEALRIMLSTVREHGVRAWLTREAS